jgi:hypothetical protein
MAKVTVKLTGYVRYNGKRYPPGKTLEVSEAAARKIVKYGAGYILEQIKEPAPGSTAEADSGPGVAPDPGPDPTDATLVAPVSQLTVKELKELAAERGIEVSPRARKAELIEILSRE